MLELVVVLVMLSILSAVILPEMRGTYDDELLRATSRRLISAMNLATSQAITVHDPHRLRLDARAGRYQIERLNSDPETENPYIPVRHVSGAEGPLDPRVRFEIRRIASDSAEEAPDNDVPSPPGPEGDSEAVLMDSIAFHPDGTADGREIVLRDRAGFGLILRVNPVTARVRVVATERTAP